MSIWDTPGIVDDLKKHWGDGMSGTQVANALNEKYETEISRTAAMAKLHRMGLLGGRAGSNAVALKTAAARKARPSGDAVPFKAQTWFTIQKSPKPIEPFVERQFRDFDVSKLVTFGELEDHHCRMPVGDPRSDELRFCGERKVLGMSWCAECAKIVFGYPDASSVDATGGSEAAGGDLGAEGGQDALEVFEDAGELPESELEGV